MSLSEFQFECSLYVDGNNEKKVDLIRSSFLANLAKVNILFCEEAPTAKEVIMKPDFQLMFETCELSLFGLIQGVLFSLDLEINLPLFQLSELQKAICGTFKAMR